MPLQNRVNPFGELLASPARGTMMGNRGGKFHRDDRMLGKRRGSSRHWICCDIHYKNRKHEAMGAGYTEAIPRKSIDRTLLITPPLFVTILANGFQPRWHESAARLASV